MAVKTLIGSALTTVFIGTFEKLLPFEQVLIVLIGGILSGGTIFAASFLGLLIKTLGIDFVIAQIKKLQSSETEES